MPRRPLLLVVSVASACLSITTGILANLVADKIAAGVAELLWPVFFGGLVVFLLTVGWLTYLSAAANAPMDPALPSAVSAGTPASSHGLLHRDMTVLRRNPAQLPRTLSDFTGRGGDVEKILRRVGSEATKKSVVVLWGLPGVGKTTLAIHLAHHLKQSHGGGQIYLDLRGQSSKALDASDALTELLRSIGVDGSAIPSGTSAKSGMFRSILASSCTVLVLDNASSAEQLEPLLPGDATNTVLVTSRSALSAIQDVERYEVRPLPSDEATLLITRIIGERRARAESDALRSLLGYCDGLPLALRIVGSRIGARGGLSLADVVRPMSDERARLTAMRIGHLAVSTGIGVSYEEQSQSGRKIFRRLALLPSQQFDGWVVPALGPGEISSPPVALAELVEAGLVQERYLPDLHSTSYSVHELVRAYATERLLAEEDPATLRRVRESLLDAYVGFAVETLRLVQSRGTDQTTGILPTDSGESAEDPRRLLSRELRNILVMVAMANEHCLWDGSIRLVNAVLPFAELSASWDEWHRLSDLGLSAARASSDTLSVMVLMRTAGRVLRESGDWVAAFSRFEESLKLAREEGNRKVEADNLRSMGAVLRYRGDREGAWAGLQQALAIYQQIGDVAGRAAALRSLGLVRRDEGDYAEAYALHRSGLELFRTIRDHVGEARSLRNMGILCTFLGRHDEAMDLLRDSVEIFGRMGDPRGSAASLRNYGDALLAGGRPGEALSAYRTSLAAFNQIGDRHWAAATLRSVGDLAVAVGNCSAALEAFADALALYRTLGDRPRQVQVLRKMANAEVRLGRPGSALPFLRDALGIVDSLAMSEAAELRLEFEWLDRRARADMR